MLIYIDGDNSPGSRTEGVGELSERDTVKIFYASNNKFYSQENNRNKLKEQCGCRCEFVAVKPGNNAVDFAIVIHAVRDHEAGEIGGAVCFVSGDQHFDMIAKQLKDVYDDEINVTRVATIEEAVARYYMMEVRSLSELHEHMCRQFGVKRGAAAYNRLKQMFSVQGGKSEAEAEDLKRRKVFLPLFRRKSG